MKKRLLLNLRHVPDDECEEVLDLLDRHHIPHYTTPPGPFGISAGGIWVREIEDMPRARALFDAYQQERAERFQAARARAREDGREERFVNLWAKQPLTVLLMILLSVMVLMIFFAPMLQLAKL